MVKGWFWGGLGLVLGWFIGVSFVYGRGGVGEFVLFMVKWKGAAMQLTKPICARDPWPGDGLDVSMTQHPTILCQNNVPSVRD